MKNFFQLFFFCTILLGSNAALAQEDLDVTGVWTGQIYNDSTGKYIPFELAISLKNGVFSGYSYTVFLIDSIENIGVKEITLSGKNGLYIIKDRKLIDDNYSDRPAKGVYTTFELAHSQNDTADVLSGRWFTNKTKQYYPLSGTAYLTKRRRIYETRIIRRLSYLGLVNRLSFVAPSHGNDLVVDKKVPRKDQDQKEEPVMTIVEPELVIEIPRKDTTKIKLPDPSEMTGILDSAEKKGVESAGAVANKIQTGQKADQRTASLSPPKDLSGRKIETIQAVKVLNDSIVLSLFDNGTIDGDTVSVLLNGKTIISRVGLLATAYNHTIHLTPDMGDSIRIILYAENLGSIPPNTGLLVVRDGDVNHEIRFSGDLKNNSAIILLRNKRE